MNCSRSIRDSRRPLSVLFIIWAGSGGPGGVGNSTGRNHHIIRELNYKRGEDNEFSQNKLRVLVLLARRPLKMNFGMSCRRYNRHVERGIGERKND